MDLLQRVGFLIGWGCFALAFLGAAAESIHGTGLITPLSDILRVAVPEKWQALESQFSEAPFSLILSPLYYLPGWFIAGLPAGFLLWTCRPHREDLDPDLYDSLLVYDQLAKEAALLDAAPDDPTFQDLRVHDDDLELASNTLEDTNSYMKDWSPEIEEEELSPDEKKERDAPMQRAKSSYDQMEDARAHMTIPFDKLH